MFAHGDCVIGNHDRSACSWGGYESLVFPALASSLNTPSLMRLHIGLEDPKSLISDLDQAFSVL